MIARALIHRSLITVSPAFPSFNVPGFFLSRKASFLQLKPGDNSTPSLNPQRFRSSESLQQRIQQAATPKFGPSKRSHASLRQFHLQWLIVDQLVERYLVSYSFSLCYGGTDVGGGATVLGRISPPSDIGFTHSVPYSRKQFWAVAVGVLSVLLVSVSGCLLVYQALAYGWYGDINNELNTYEPVGAIAPEQELQPL